MSSVFCNYAKAGYPLLWVETHEEYRAMNRYCQELEKVKLVNEKTKEEEHYVTFAWDIVDGVRQVNAENGLLAHGKSIKGTAADDAGEKPAALKALEWLEDEAPDNTILFLKDYHSFVGKESRITSIITRKIRNLIPNFKACGKVIAIISPIKDIPVEIEKEISVVPFRLPDREQLKLVLQGVCESADAKYPKEDQEIIDASLGMTYFEAENAFSVSLIEKKKFDPETIRREKAAIVRKGGQLEVVESAETLDDIGGLENLKEWLMNRRNCFSEDARVNKKIKTPKGVLLIGKPGTGKSLAAKAVASAWGRPLLRFDVGRVMGSYVGESEANLRRCLAIAEAVAPCVLWIDELEKSFSGTSSGDSDGHGTTKRVFQEFLTWLQEKKADVFIVATANDVGALPPELIRPGRIDSIFYVDLPDEIQREEILNIHLVKSGYDPASFKDGMSKIIEASVNFSGAAIEAWLEEAKIRAFNRKKDLAIEDFLKTASNVSQSEIDLKNPQKWAKAASKSHKKTEAPKTGRKIAKD